ncbi:MAG: filamentous hemagglutinin N-terminal domain-containing protein, partial [Cyanobacteria bacterium P01_H01_bin.105]
MIRFQTLWCRGLQKILCAAGITTTVLWNIDLWANAQVISSQDSVHTQVTQQDNQFEIFGGTVTDSETLLFHSFEQFNLERGQTAEFYVAPDIEAVFSRITNGIPSRINGHIELTGSAASLYLINPAGVLFGAESSINLAGDFTVLTAERLDFSQGNFDLSGHPTGV